jgi:hypothetical protein
MALKHLKLRYYCVVKSDKIIYAVFGWKYVKKLEDGNMSEKVFGRNEVSCNRSLVHICAAKLTDSCFLHSESELGAFRGALWPACFSHLPWKSYAIWCRFDESVLAVIYGQKP